MSTGLSSYDGSWISDRQCGCHSHTTGSEGVVLSLLGSNRILDVTVAVIRGMYVCMYVWLYVCMHVWRV